MKKREKARRTHAAVRVFLPFFMLTFYYEKNRHVVLKFDLNCCRVKTPLPSFA